MNSFVITGNKILEVYKGRKLLLRVRTYPPLDGGIERLEVPDPSDIDTIKAMTGLAVMLDITLTDVRAAIKKT